MVTKNLIWDQLFGSLYAQSKFLWVAFQAITHSLNLLHSWTYLPHSVESSTFSGLAMASEMTICVHIYTRTDRSLTPKHWIMSCSRASQVQFSAKGCFKPWNFCRLHVLPVCCLWDSMSQMCISLKACHTSHHPLTSLPPWSLGCLWNSFRDRKSQASRNKPHLKANPKLQVSQESSNSRSKWRSIKMLHEFWTLSSEARWQVL